ncbi:MAG: coenzyme F420-0:L-glutamate ligase [bacterium]|nr:coenzyme F420-0:L-glutamate ligase [bacterium]MDA1292702.1 coenzyme F420-0:L-glutamate ligase [bacterium]
MYILPIKTPILKAGDNLASILLDHADIADGDILVISSKAVATVEGAAIKLDSVDASAEAKDLAVGNSKSAEYYQVVLDETARMNGTVIQSVYGIILTELKPNGMHEGSIFVPNAGLDQSNIVDGFVIGWPKDPVQSASRFCQTNKRIPSVAVIISDSGLCPRRKGVVSFALTVCGMDPFISLIGEQDLFGNAMSVTEEAVADQLATAANFLMGNTNQSTPAVIIRDHGLTLSHYCGWVEGIERERDLYHGVI